MDYHPGYCCSHWGEECPGAVVVAAVAGIEPVRPVRVQEEGTAIAPEEARISAEPDVREEQERKNQEKLRGGDEMVAVACEEK